jgi:hypothetical protein
MSSSFIHFSANDIILLYGQAILHCIYLSQFFIHFIVGTHLDWVCMHIHIKSTPIVNSTVTNLSLQVSLIKCYHYIGYLPRNVIAVSYGSYIVRFLMNLQTVFHNDRKYSTQTVCDSYLSSAFSLAFIFVCVDICVFLILIVLTVVTWYHSYFDKHFPNGQWHWTIFDKFVS